MDKEEFLNQLYKHATTMLDDHVESVYDMRQGGYSVWRYAKYLLEKEDID